MTEPQIGDIRIIKADSLNWQCQQWTALENKNKRSEGYGTTRHDWVDCGYYGTLKNAFDYGILAKVGNHMAPGVEDVKAVYDAALLAIKEFGKIK